MTKKNPRQPNNSKKARDARREDTEKRLKGESKAPWNRGESKEKSEKINPRETQSGVAELRGQIASLFGEIKRVRGLYYLPSEELEEAVSDLKIKKSQEKCVEDFLSKSATKTPTSFTKEDMQEAFECIGCLSELIKWTEEKADYINKVFEESERSRKLYLENQRFVAAAKSMEEATKNMEASPSSHPQISNWDIDTINKRLFALEEENLELTSEIELLKHREKEFHAIQRLMTRWFFLLSQDQEFNYADLLKVLGNPEIRDPNEEEPFNASFGRTQEAERTYREAMGIPKITKRKEYVLEQIWSAIAEHNQKCEIYDDLVPICPWLPVIKIVADTYFLDIGRTTLRRSPAEYKEQSFLAAYHFFKNYNPQEFCLSEDDSRKLIEEWNFSYTKKVGLKPSVEKKISSTFTSTDFCSTKLADSERNEIVESSIAGVIQLFGTSCEIRLRDEILREITEAKL